MPYTHLVIVPCHGIWKGTNDENPEALCIGDDRNEWFLAPFQIEGSDHLCFKEHLLRGAEILDEDPSSVVVISGGFTKGETEVSEADSYYNLLKELRPESDAVTSKRGILETYARDSFENVLFSICRFYEEFKAYPEKISVVGFEFKRSRFLEHHFSQALAFPSDRVEYIGNAPTPETNEAAYFKDLDGSEYNFAVKFFKEDYYGTCNPLMKKKLARNPFKLQHNYHVANPALEEFLDSIKDGTDASPQESRAILMKTAPWLQVS